MGLVFITGISGSGKTALSKELKKRDCEVYDADEKLSFWASKLSGEKISVSDHTLTTDPQFFENHDWHIDKQEVKKLAQDASDRTIYICGSVANEKEVWEYFEKVFCLYVDDNSLIERVNNRVEKDFGKAEHELAHLLKLNKEVKLKYKLLGATLIDTAKPLKEIADEVLIANR